jgi:hypothetical protein
MRLGADGPKVGHRSLALGNRQLCVVFGLMKGYNPELVSFEDLVPLAAALAMSLVRSWLSWDCFEGPLVAQGHGSRY